MGEWDVSSYEGKNTLLRAVRREAEGFFSLVERPEAWEATTACTEWQVRDAVGHIVDTTESYFVAFDTARSGREAKPAYGLPGMAERVNTQAQSFRNVPQAELVERLRTDFAKMMELAEALGPDEWGGLIVPHFYMGPLPAFFYPWAQLVDYGVHSWDIRQGTGRAHGLVGDTADLLVHFVLIVLQNTAAVPEGMKPFSVGVRVTSGANAGSWRFSVSQSGIAYEPGDVDDLPAVLEFDPGSFVLTCYGRGNFGTIRGDLALAESFLNLFFRI
jgi:uncharacterized protein (TIGR03083 family)